VPCSVAALAAFLLVAGCGGDKPRADAGSDAGAALDAPAFDAPPGDASFGPCTASGVPGECLDVAACDGARRSVPGLCPGPAEIQCCVPEAAGACDPDAMPLPNEGLVEEPGEAGCPDGMIAVTSAFCIDRFEASLVEIRGDGTEAGWSPYFNPGTRRVRAVSLRGAVPQGYVSGTQAAAACAEAGARLCTDAEWLRACQGSTGLTYPYGATRVMGTCNDHRDVHPAVEYFGTSEPWIWSELDHPCISQLPMSLARTGALPGCVAESGALDMMGNLHEWTDDPAGTFRGGFYGDTVMNGPGCLDRTTAHDVSHWDYSTGFRCCAAR
jgi:hypothetical protein